MINGFTAYNLDLNTLRVITLVREFALKDYHEKRAWLHDRWLKDSEFLLKSNRVVLSYPDMPTYPTESEILITAKEIIELMKNPVTDGEIKAAAESLKERPSGPSFPMEPVQPPMPEPEPIPEPQPAPVQETPPPTEKIQAEEVEDGERSIHNEISWILERLYDTRSNKNQSK
jgi:hypothetical protein